MSEQAPLEPRLSSLAVTAATVTLALLWASAAHATTAQFLIRKCIARTILDWDDEEEPEKKRTKYRRFFVDGRFGTTIAWRLADDFALSFAARLDSPRKATYVENAGLDAVTVERILDHYQLPGSYDLLGFDIRGKRKVDRRFRKSKEKVKVDFGVRFTDGIHAGRGLDVRWSANCKKKGKRRD